jgi:hypothetical protein
MGGKSHHHQRQRHGVESGQVHHRCFPLSRVDSDVLSIDRTVMSTNGPSRNRQTGGSFLLMPPMPAPLAPNQGFL